MDSKKSTFLQVWPTSLFFGFIGAALMIGIRELDIFTKAYFQIVPIPIVMIVALLRIRKTAPIELNFHKAFLTGFLTYVSLVMFYAVYVKSYVEPSESGWNALLGWSILIPLTFNLITAIISSSVLALFFKAKNNKLKLTNVNMPKQ